MVYWGLWIIKYFDLAEVIQESIVEKSTESYSVVLSVVV